MDITVQRNAFGRQRESFETDLSVPSLGNDPLHAVFIRAPLITHVGNDVTVLASLQDGRTVAARQENLLVASFHPELTDDSRLHRYFVTMVCERS
jgi:5'-phosphate synthase pdxT subunit